MKRELFINIILGVTLVIIIGFIIMHNSSKQITPTPTKTKQTTISMNEFSLHNTPNNCWVRINGKVYNVTNFLNAHPGGPEKITPFCGGADATEAFNTKGGKGTHSARAKTILDQMLVGTLAK